MSDDEQMNVSSTGGHKAGNLERYDLIPAEPLRLLAKHYGIGAKKYTDDNWRKGYDWRLSFAALNRHLWKMWAGEWFDKETGTPHIIAVAWHAFTLQEFSEIHPEFDTRLMTLDQRAVRSDKTYESEGTSFEIDPVPPAAREKAPDGWVRAAESLDLGVILALSAEECYRVSRRYWGFSINAAASPSDDELFLWYRDQRQKDPAYKAWFKVVQAHENPWLI
ncbi:MAG: DUF5664 domain-containing protein [Actinobacteria bacterium]|nr:DUF5664 domain-containing protein [Actinomycetota bacterium]